MDSFEWNKVFMAVLMAALSVMLINTAAPALFDTGGEHGAGHGGEHGGEGGLKLAYAVEVLEEVGAQADAGPALEEPSLAEMMAAATMSKGERQFGKCRACHTIQEGGNNGIGPNLYGILNNVVASKDGYNYSSALASIGGEWTYERLDAWIANPKKFAAGNKMSFAGLGKANQRADLILYLRNFGDSDVPLPVLAAAEDAAEAVEDTLDETLEEGANSSGR